MDTVPEMDTAVPEVATAAGATASPAKTLEIWRKLWQTETEIIAPPEVDVTAYQNFLGLNQVQFESFRLQYLNKRLNITRYHHQAMLRE